MEIPVVESLFWFFFGLSTNVLMLWSAFAFRAQRSPASRAMLIGAIVDFPLSLISNIYWYVWPMGVTSDLGLTSYDPWSSDYPFDEFMNVVDYGSPIFFLIWLVGVVFVGMRYRAELRHARDLASMNGSQSEGSPPPDSEKPG